MIPLSELNPTLAFKEVLEATSTGAEAIYADGEKPSSNLPKNFIDVMNNGTIKAMSTDGGIKYCVIACSIYVKLINGATNTVKNRILLSTFEEIFKTTISHNGYEFTIDFLNLVADTKNILTDYSTKTLNINVKIL